MSREQLQIEHNGKTYLVDAEILPAEPDVGLMSEGSEDHILCDPDTEERLKDFEKAMTDKDWDEIADKFNEAYADAKWGLDAHFFQPEFWS